jgi:hypothetical protein
LATFDLAWAAGAFVEVSVLVNGACFEVGGIAVRR